MESFFRASYRDPGVQTTIGLRGRKKKSQKREHQLACANRSWGGRQLPEGLPRNRLTADQLSACGRGVENLFMQRWGTNGEEVNGGT